VIEEQVEERNDGHSVGIDGFWLPDGVFCMACNGIYMPLHATPESLGKLYNM
jgi:hypothetical protein